MINKTLKKIIDDVIAKRKDKHGWDSGSFAKIIELSADQRGEIGERLLEHLLKEAGVSGVTRAGKVDRTEKHWDIRTDDMDIEVKTATLGRNTDTFQHESIEKDRNYQAIVFIDIAPNEIYITWTAKKNITWRNLHRRANSTAYKWDTRLKELQGNKATTINDIKTAYTKLLSEI